MITGKAILWASFAGISLLAGLYQNDVQFLVLGLFLAVFLSISMVRSRPSLEVERDDPRLKIFAGDTARVSLRVRNTGGEADVLEIYDHAPGYARLHASANHDVLNMPQDSEKRSAYQLHFPVRGYYNVGPVHLRWGDAFGFSTEEQLLKRVSHLPVFVSPGEARGIDVDSRAFEASFGPKHINQVGVSDEFHSIRDYVKTDPFRKINWKVYARRRKLMVNTDERETLSNCMLFIDSREVTGAGTPSHNFLEAAVTLSSSISTNLIRNNNRLGVVIYGSDIRIIPIGLGRNHSTYIQYNLIQAQAAGATTLSLAAAYAMPYLKPRTVIILLSPLTMDTTFLQTAQWFTRMGHKVVVLTCSTMEYEAIVVGRFTYKNVLDSQARQNVLDQLQAMGARIVTFGPDDAPAEVLGRVEFTLEGFA